ncbi:tectonin domain-containing protein [Streptomyces hydrogenans]|uniref:tectonin domain-containing protein n=1 Tax=Streptomyces hydrogenans TaxID=1873719 RepID=UPI0035DFF345
MAGGLVKISAGSRSNVWGVNANGQIYRFTNDDATPWHGVPGGLTDISAAADGTVWGVNANSEIYRYIGDQP